MRKKQKTKLCTIQSLEQVKQFIEENNFDISQRGTERSKCIRKYAEQFNVTTVTAREHFSKYEDYLFMNQ